MKKTSKLYLAVHRGQVRSAIRRHLEADSYTNHVNTPRQDQNLMEPGAMKTIYESEHPEQVFV